MPRKECGLDSARTSRNAQNRVPRSVQNFFDIIYMGIFPGGMGDRQSSRGHAYLTVVPPWDRRGRKAGGARADRPINIAVDVEMLIQLGCRLYAPGDGEALVTEDWITNKVIIYAYDAELVQSHVRQLARELPGKHQEISRGREERRERDACPRILHGQNGQRV